MSGDDLQTVSGYFGPPAARKPWERQMPVPVGAPCAYCDDLIEERDIGTMDRVGQVLHYECSIRMTVGSLGHQMGLCSCAGGTMEDPEGVSVHEAARAAARYHQVQHVLIREEGS